MVGGVCSSQKSELLPSAKLRLPNPSPTSKLQVPPNQGHRSVFDIFCDDLLLLVGGGLEYQMPAWMHIGCLRGDVPP